MEKSQAHAFALGGEEGIKDLFAQFRRHAGSGVRQGDFNARAARSLSFWRFPLRLAAFRPHRFIGVEHQIRENLLSQFGIERNGGKLRWRSVRST